MRLHSARLRLALLAVGVSLATLGGCSKKGPVPGSTVEETATAFASALDKGDLKGAAGLFDYLDFARKNNDNWDDIPSGQRQQIISKLTADKAEELAAYKQKLGGNIKCGAAQDSQVALTGDAGTMTLELREREGKWYISSVW